MSDAVEVLVVGGGIAGAAAALAARAAGRSVALVRAGPGATAMAAGGWTGPLPPPLGEALAGVGLPLEPVGRRLPHPSGELVPADYAPPGHADARLDHWTLVCGIMGLASFHAPALARLWGGAAGVTLISATIDMGDAPPAGWSAPSLAAVIEQDPGRLADPLARAVRSTGARRAILPAVLGLDASGFAGAALERAAGVPVAEALGVPPSIPGWRLDRALLKALDDSGVTVHTGRVIHAVSDGPRLLAVELRRGTSSGTDSGAADIALSATAFVLAAGKFAAGGVVGDERGLREPALGCPVWIQHLGQTFDASVDPLLASRAARLDVQPLLGAGVHVDGSGRPVDPDGDVVYRNVFVAGSILANRETARLGLGESARDGWAAGTAAAAVAEGA